MGYYTLHRIRIINEYNTKNNLEIIRKTIKNFSRYEFNIIGSTICDDSWNEGYGAKWYSCNMI